MMKKSRQFMGQERDEILEMVSRIKRADEVNQKAFSPKIDVSKEDKTWAEDNQLPVEFFEFFEIDRAS